MSTKSPLLHQARLFRFAGDCLRSHLSNHITAPTSALAVSDGQASSELFQLFLRVRGGVAVEIVAALIDHRALRQIHSPASRQQHAGYDGPWTNWIAEWSASLPLFCCRLEKTTPCFYHEISCLRVRLGRRPDDCTATSAAEQ